MLRDEYPRDILELLGRDAASATLEQNAANAPAARAHPGDLPFGVTNENYLGQPLKPS